VKYMDVGGASCLFNRRIKYFHKCIVEYIDILGGFIPGNMRFKYLYNMYCEIY
jgi:hypothetical protein